MSFRFLRCASVATVAALLTTAGCSQVRGRKRIQEANELYRRGRYAEAVALYDEAAELVPGLPVLWLNRGYTCRQLIAPRGADPDSRRAAACALDSFKHLAAVAPGDPRAGELTIQTWFDIEDYGALEATFLDRARRAPNDLESVRGLQDVYFRSGKWRQALTWAKRAAAMRPDDAEAQYGVGTFVWQVLTAHGGSAELASYDPWPRASTDGRRRDPPAAAPAPDDVAGSARVDLADLGISYLEKAVAKRPRYPEAMTYLGLLWRQKSLGLIDDPIAWQGAVDAADQWQRLAARAGSGKS
jgi:tetratricopeptide (TPR) repeat protein